LTGPRLRRDDKQLPRDERQPLPPTQIGRALRELGITWIAAHSPQAKGRIERSFATAQDRLVKGLRVAGASTLAQANEYLQEDFLPWWNQHLTVLPANPTDAHRALGSEHALAVALSRVETRQVDNDYTFRCDGRKYQIARADVRTGMRGGTVRIEARLDGSLHVRFQDRYVAVSECQPASKPAPKPAPASKAAARAPRKPTEASKRSLDRLMRSPGPRLWIAAGIHRTRTPDRLD
jgi:hypothetical protein